MPQFAIEFDVNLSAGESLAASLNGLLLEKPTWEVVQLHTIITNASKLAGTQQPVMNVTAVIASPKEDMMKEPGKDFLEVVED